MLLGDAAVDDSMKVFINAVRAAVKQENWYAALALALTLPDICADLEKPGRHSGERYADWWNTYLLPEYTIPGIEDVREPHVLLSGNDCYALRCAFLHQGLSDISRQRAQEAISRFHFAFPNPNRRIVRHRNQLDDVLQLQVDLFCEDICLGAEQWEQEKLLKETEIMNRANKMLVIFPPDMFGNQKFRLF